MYTACFGLISHPDVQAGHYKATAAATGSFLSWYYAAALHEFVFTGLFD
jgi:hypothetical protein